MVVSLLGSKIIFVSRLFVAARFKMIFVAGFIQSCFVAALKIIFVARYKIIFGTGFIQSCSVTGFKIIFVARFRVVLLLDSELFSLLGYELCFC